MGGMYPLRRVLKARCKAGSLIRFRKRGIRISPHPKHVPVLQRNTLVHEHSISCCAFTANEQTISTGETVVRWYAGSIPSATCSAIGYLHP